MPNPTYPDVTVQLTGVNGNAFMLIGAVTKVVADRFGPTSTAMARLIGDVSFYALDSHGLPDVDRIAAIAGLMARFAVSPAGVHLHLLDDVTAGAS